MAGVEDLGKSLCLAGAVGSKTSTPFGREKKSSTMVSEEPHTSLYACRYLPPRLASANTPGRHLPGDTGLRRPHQWTLPS